jgi:hypothetical protein
MLLIKKKEIKMKTLLLSLILTTSSAFAQFSGPEIPAHGLTLKCRSAGDIYQTDYEKDGRLYLTAKIFKANLLEEVIIKLENYKSQKKDLKIIKVPAKTGPITIIEAVVDEKFSFTLSNLPELESSGNRIDTFSANIGVVKNPLQGGFAINKELRCKLFRN